MDTQTNTTLSHYRESFVTKLCCVVLCCYKMITKQLNFNMFQKQERKKQKHKINLWLMFGFQSWGCTACVCVHSAFAHTLCFTYLEISLSHWVSVAVKIAMKCHILTDATPSAIEYCRYVLFKCSLFTAHTIAYYRGRFSSIVGNSQQFWQLLKSGGLSIHFNCSAYAVKLKTCCTIDRHTEREGVCNFLQDGKYSTKIKMKHHLHHHNSTRRFNERQKKFNLARTVSARAQNMLARNCWAKKRGKSPSTVGLVKILWL